MIVGKEMIMLTPEEIRQRTAQFLEAFNRHDLEAIGSGLSDDVTRRLPRLPEPTKGVEAVKGIFKTTFDAFPDATVEFVTQVVEGDHCVVEYVLNGTHTGVLEGGPQPIPPTGKSLRLNGVMIVKVGSDGKIIEMREYYDMATMMAQLGLLG